VGQIYTFLINNNKITKGIKMEICIVWSTEDVLQTAKNMNVELTSEEADDVLMTVEHNHDANYGISWDNIEWAITDLVNSKTKTK
jgi:hypothetical protein